ncbi:p-aminobenzoyl-glutamate transporter [Halobacillus halophilus]|uniref:AbgT family transporter (Probable substrate aminobenzoyl-glutamate) n=1 Tax=Halobacillus halophilus (strain ATCC 35676 / DSM 2266 / JCM 20832 / KCTC 3685 / LMG 17431 / NBRC 102448 / NCIMB 2269) TaxID=866895 RepID=I0JIF0_HALH3|nr:AbgT family transporter [Halobacillus halophilus]ASF38101.1 p-aminobenzoyl-glutamate transporter [Halobacillus halophilus]CCG43918.1 AbgT family transporter (probable substrate aminobenzoyl-glutamate) [Halobacillus halophilus DSM 2266]
MSNNNEQSSKGMARFLNFIERVGNKLPEPFMLFVYLAGFTILFSWVVSLFGVTVEEPGTGEEVAIQSLVSGDGLEYILTSMLDNFTGFAPLGLVLAMMLGIGLADKVGLLETAIKSTILKAPKSLITYAVIFVGILGNLASDAAFVIVPPLAAMVFYTIGRHPLAGLAAGFAGVGSGFTANIIIAGTDALLSGISTEVMQSIGSDIVVTPVDNWYFMIASVVVLSITGALITEKIIEPRLGKYEGEGSENELEASTTLEKKGFRNAVISGLVFIAILIIALAWPGSALRNEEGGIIPSPFLDGIVPIILFFFITIGITYGVTVKKIESTRDISGFMSEAMKDMSGFIVLIFAAAQFIAYFDWTNIGTWVAVSGANALEAMNMTGLPVVVGFSMLTALMNLLIFSGSAQWALEAPIFLQMFYLLDYHPAFIQAAYRIADSSTNIITPMNPYIIVVLAFMREYNKKAGLGTLISLMLPYSIIFFAIWVVLLVAFALLGIPFGPGVDMYINQ